MSSEKDKEDWSKPMSGIHEVSMMLGSINARLDNIEKSQEEFRKEMHYMNKGLTNAKVKQGGVTIVLSILLTILVNIFLKVGL